MTGTHCCAGGFRACSLHWRSAAMPAAASADGLNIGLNGCPARPTEHPFARWLDSGNYVLAPGGTFEGSLGGWKLTGGAKVVSGSESFAVHGAGEKHALSLPVGQLGDDAADVRRASSIRRMRYFAANDGGLLSLLTRPDPLLPAGRRRASRSRSASTSAARRGRRRCRRSSPRTCSALLNGGQAQRRVPLHADRARREVADRRRLRRSPCQPLDSSGCANAVRRWPSAARRAARAGPPRCGPARVPRRRAGRRSGPARRRRSAAPARPRRAPTTSRRRRACRSKASPPNARAGAAAAEVAHHDLGVQHRRHAGGVRAQAQVQVLVEQERAGVERAQAAQQRRSAPRGRRRSPSRRAAARRARWGCGQRARGQHARARAPPGRPGSGCALRCSAPSASSSRGTSSASPPAARAAERGEPGVEQLAVGVEQDGHVVARRARRRRCWPPRSPGCRRARSTSAPAARASAGPSSREPESTTTSWASAGEVARERGQQRRQLGRRVVQDGDDREAHARGLGEQRRAARRPRAPRCSAAARSRAAAPRRARRASSPPMRSSASASAPASPRRDAQRGVAQRLGEARAGR